ncbi:baseplate multidomain protein megatron [Sulfitobacter donghicola]|uniref:Gene transfer agent protein n=1 Tax=Sulfitobacter donghicola DSW-25 = KCTC 12864 = JCM 14565 TaxID=1300350 RepID=A0A073IKD2_9RHOB|nr:glycoside hydrolase TIM-barrel-like domain-containing protein [Sulfitobacter donghicola]KEJ90214.1 gene transfer agent protein [Sulfitobacter donghicola DSW-25 = KCTC 12864 = JCM 14565]KIN66618.1 putative GTA protein [Sulfitobacter donghicola DSW-25 = KCTC 12864 = JCM 14565]
MATILFSAAGAAVGGSVGGTFAGLSSVAIGRAVGATVGRVVDQKILGTGSQAVETGKVDRFRITSAGEGDPITQLYGRMRLGGQVIWASDFEEVSATTGGGKGTSSTTKTTTYSYSVNLAIALCEGEITRVGRIWADGEEIAPDSLNMTVYTGSEDQQPDSLMEAIEGTGLVPAYRGTAYVVLEGLGLEPFGNRVPQFSFEVMRPEQRGADGASHALSYGVEGVALIPGTGEYSLATTPVSYGGENEARWSANINSPSGKTDFSTSLEALDEELPELKSASLVVSWFGSDLRASECLVQPKVEDPQIEGEEMPWTVAGVTRSTAEIIAQGDDGRPIYGGTPADKAVVEAIQAMNEAGKAVMFYPFILMDQLEGNSLPNPYTGEDGQPELPWRGRITLDAAPGQDGSSDGTAAAENEVSSFFGTVTASDFAIEDGEVTYTGPQEWSLSRFILHYAALCKAAGGVDAFCIGSEMRGLTQIRSGRNSFPAVEAFILLAGEVRNIVGPDTKISYAADWSEYFGYQPQDGTGDRLFHLDPLWADANIDFIGIDNYMPLSDWREGVDHLDAQNWDDIYNLDYLQANIEGGEGYDWYYGSVEEREAQIRTPITDGDHDEAWIYRYKDIRNWWGNLHYDRIDGARSNDPTVWLAGQKPIWFTEYGCAAIDKGTNQPNKFLDLKSSESSLPRHSDGARDDLIQMQYLRAMIDYWSKAENNPDGIEYDGPMIDMSRAFAWAWDVRPYPFFPNNRELWSDGESYARGHWLNGRTSSRSLASVVAEICARSGVSSYDTTGLYGLVRGYGVSEVSDARSSLQPLMVRYGFDAIERDGVLKFQMRDGLRETSLDAERFAVSEDLDGITVQSREADATLSGRVRLRFVQADASFDVISEEAVLPDEETHAVSASEFSMLMTRAEGRQVAERWLNEARIARDSVKFALPPSKMPVRAGDVVSIPADQGEGASLYRVDRVDQAEHQQVEAIRIDPEIYDQAPLADELVTLRRFVAPVPVTPLFLDLPLLTGDETPYAPHIAASANPWPGSVALYSSATDQNYALNTILPLRSTVGVTQTALSWACSGLFDRGEGLQVKLVSGQLETVDELALLNGANLAAIGDGSSGNWEVIQFQKAELIAPQTYLLSDRLRGQAGSDGLMPDVWPIGSQFVLLNSVPLQIEMNRNQRGVEQNYRIGPALRPVDDPSYRHLQLAFEGNGLRPYAPAHLRAVETAGGDISVTWLRRTRVDGDSWDVVDVPLGEESESYLLRVVKDGQTLREELLASPNFEYPEASQSSDGAIAPFHIEVSQVSASYGAGLPKRIEIQAA